VARCVVVTGLGVVSSLGHEVDGVWRRVLGGESGIARITKFDAARHASQVAGEVLDFDAQRYVEPREAAFMDEFTAFAACAAKQALDDSGLLSTPLCRKRIGVSIGSAMGGFRLITDTDRLLQKSGPRRISPLFIPFILPDAASGYVSIQHKLRGPNHITVSACATSANALGESLLMIRNGQADAMVAGGSDALVSDLVVAGFAAARALSTRNDEPTKASRPFDKDRDGFVIAEGAAVLVLEERQHALNRGATIYAELAGYATNADAFHITQPDPDGMGARECMSEAMENAGIAPEQIGHINAHGTSTPTNDLNETRAIKKVFGEGAYKIPISSTKSMTGHLLGAAGAIEAIFSVLALRDGVLPPTINLDHPDPECDLDYVPHKARRHEAEYALSNSFGFGGHNTSLVFRRVWG
jgi:3-oxoacyl-[acyl-carrier-protein] synthase II